MYLNNSITSAFSLGHLVNDLLDHAKLETSTFALNYEHFNLYEVVTEAFEISQFAAKQKQIILLLEHDVSTPFILRKVYSDKRRLT